MKDQAALLKQAYKELNAPRPAGYQLTPAELKRRLLLIAHEKGQQLQTESTTQKELF